MLGLGVGLGLPFLNNGAASSSNPFSLDFTTGLPAAFTLSRTGTRYARDANGKWQAYLTDVARLHHDEIGSPLGILFEKSHVDLCFLQTNPAGDPSGTAGAWGTEPATFWTKAIPGSGGMPSLAGTGYEDIFSTVYQGVNATGSDLTYALDTVVGSTNKMSLQSLMNDFSGSGLNASRVRISSGSQASPTAFGDWEAVLFENETPTNTTRTAQIINRANRTCGIAYVQMSRAAYCPTLLLHPTDNVAITVGNEYASALVSALPAWSTSEIAFAFEWYHEWPFVTDNEPIFSIAKAATPTTDYLRIVGMADGTMKIEMVIASSTIFSMTFAAPTRRTVCRAAIRLKSASFLAAVNGAGGTVDTDAGDWSGLDTCYINRLDTAYSNSITRAIQLTTIHQTDDQIIAASASAMGGFV